MKNFIIYLLFIFQSSFVLANEICPNYPESIEKDVKLFSGIGENTARSYKRALVNLQQSLFESKVETQFISEYVNGKTSYQINKQVQVDGNVRGIDNVLHLQCSDGYITYLLFDGRTLELKLATFFEKKAVKLFGPAYLLNSQRLKKYNNQHAENKLEVKLTTGINKEIYLLIGAEQFKLTDDEIKQLLVTFLSTNNSLISMAYQASYKTQLIIDYETTEQFSLFICNFYTSCQLLSSIQPSNQVFNLLGSGQISNSETEHVIIAVKKQVIDNVSFYENKIQDSWFFSLLDLAEQYPKETFIKTTKFRNF